MGIRTFRQQTFSRQTFRLQTFRRPNISPTDNSPTNISPTDISPTDISPKRQFADRLFVDRQFVEIKITYRVYFDKVYTNVSHLIGLHRKMYFVMYIQLCIVIQNRIKTHMFKLTVCFQFLSFPYIWIDYRTRDLA